MTSLLPTTADDVDIAYQRIFAPCVKAQGLEVLAAEEGRVTARLPDDPE